jgi:2-polyprenyl-6-methoxyphenol hydroxylase-like FAD-dependent oxidoreductase
MTRKLKAIIAGGGFGGLTAAAALAQRGWEVVVHERQAEVRAAGSGIYVWENGLRVLDAIGASIPHDELFRGRAIEQRNHLNQVIDDGALPPDLRLVTIPRKELLNAIRQAAEKSGVVIKTGSEVISATAQGELQFAAGLSETADLAIGADGVWSVVRKALGLELFHEMTFEGALRAIVPGTQEELGEGGRDKYIECWHGDRRFLVTPLGKAGIYLALTCPKSDEPPRSVRSRELECVVPGLAALDRARVVGSDLESVQHHQCPVLVGRTNCAARRFRARAAAESRSGRRHGDAERTWPGRRHGGRHRPS